MTISDQIRMLCARINISQSELARRLGQSPQAFNAKMQRESFSFEDVDAVAEAIGVKFVRKFVLPNDEEI